MTKRINIPLWGISKKGITNVSEGVRIECYYSTVINSSNCIDFHDRSNDNNPRADNKPVSHGSRAEFYCGGNCLTAFKYLADKLGVQDEPDKDPFAR